MEFTVQARHFRDAFSLVGRAVPTKTVVPILQSVKLACDADSLTFAATDNALSIRHVLKGEGTYRPVAVESSGVALLPKSLVDAVLKVAGDDLLRFRLDGSKLTVEAERARWTLNLGNPDEFPAVPDFRCAAYHTITPADLKRLIRRTVHACDPDSTQYALGGSSVESGPTTLAFVATDGRMLAHQEVSASFTGDHAPTEGTRVVPESTQNTLSGMVSDHLTGIDLGFPDQNTIQVRFGDTVATSRLCEGRFPRWRQALPDRHETRVAVACGEFHRAIDRAAAFRSDESNAVDLLFSESGLTIASDESDRGGSVVEFALEWPGPPLEIRLNAEMVLSLLKSLGDATPITLELIDRKNPFVVRSADGFVGMVMSMTREVP